MKNANLTARIFLKITGLFVCLFLISLVFVDVIASRVVEAGLVRTLRQELTGKAEMLAMGLRTGYSLDQQNARALETASGARITIINREGEVLLDSEADPHRMDNHRSRPEFAAALAGQQGVSVRRSPTVGTQFLYVAVPLTNGALRLAMPLQEIEQQADDIRQQMLIGISLAFLPAVLLAAFVARHVSRKLGRVIDFAAELAQGNFKARLTNLGNDELGILGRKLSETGGKLQEMFEQLEREHAELEKLERIRKDFVINVSHELRTPLASIQGYTETMLDGALDDPQNNRRFLNIIRQNAERLTLLASDLMTLSRIELKTRQFQIAPYYLANLLRDSVDSMRPIAAKRNIALHLEAISERQEAFCDAEAVHQIMTNLLDNAIKYSPEGGHVFVGARPAPHGPPGREFVEVYVRDTGMGIPPEEQPRLFERFYRVDKARSRELGGTGLGLAIVKHLVLAQGGEVKVESAVGKGSTFSFTLPVEDPGETGQENVHAEFTQA